MNATAHEFTAPLADRLTPAGYRLAAPRETEAGNLIVEAVLAVPGVMEYPWGPTYVGPEALADAAWLESLAGAPVTDDDQGAHFEGVTPDTAQAVAVGTVLDARWDDQQQAVIGRLVLDVRRAIDAVRNGVRGVSPAYRAVIVARSGVDARSGLRYTHVQTRRMGADNVALTPTPRGGPAAQLRADSMADTDTQPEQDEQAAPVADASMEERLAKLEGMLAEMSDAYKGLKADMAKMMKDAADAEPVAEPEPAPAVAPVLAADAARLIRAADAHGVKADDADTLDTLRARVAAKVLGREVDGLSADALDVAITLAADAKPAPRTLPRVTRGGDTRSYFRPGGK